MLPSTASISLLRASMCSSIVLPSQNQFWLVLRCESSFGLILFKILLQVLAIIELKGAWSEIFRKLIFFKLADMVTFPTKTSSLVKKLQICISFVSNLRKECLRYLLFYKWWKPRFLISKRVFGWFLLNYIEFAHQISHIRSSKYDSTFGTKISICLKKVGGMRLWIGTTSTFKLMPL